MILMASSEFTLIDSSCVLFARAQDAFSYSDIISNIEGMRKVEDMLRFTNDIRTCRKVAFARHFSDTVSLDVHAWAADGQDPLAPCGHCDNCTRPPESIKEKNVALDAWRVVTIAQAGRMQKVNLTLADLSGALRGVGTKTKQNNLTATSGTSKLSPRESELVVVHCLLNGYLKQHYVPNSYSTNAYLIPGTYSAGLLALKEDQVEGGKHEDMIMRYAETEGAKKGRKSLGGGDGKAKSVRQKRKHTEDEEDDSEENFDLNRDDEDVPPKSTRKRARKRSGDDDADVRIMEEENGDGDDSSGTSQPLARAFAAAKARRSSGSRLKAPSSGPRSTASRLGSTVKPNGKEEADFIGSSDEDDIPIASSMSSKKRPEIKVAKGKGKEKMVIDSDEEEGVSARARVGSVRSLDRSALSRPAELSDVEDEDEGSQYMWQSSSRGSRSLRPRASMGTIKQTELSDGVVELSDSD